MKVRKLEYECGYAKDTADRWKETRYNVTFRLKKSMFQEMWDTASVTEREMMTEIVLNNKPDEKNAKLYDDAAIVIAQYNRITGRNIMAINKNGSKTSSLTLVFRTLKRGYTLRDCLTVLDIKSRQKWFFENDFFRFTIQTLFRASNFEKYVQEARR